MVNLVVGTRTHCLFFFPLGHPLMLSHWIGTIIWHGCTDLHFSGSHFSQDHKRISCRGFSFFMADPPARAGALGLGAGRFAKVQRAGSLEPLQNCIMLRTARRTHPNCTTVHRSVYPSSTICRFYGFGDRCPVYRIFVLKIFVCYGKTDMSN